MIRFYCNRTEYYPTSNPTPVLTVDCNGGWMVDALPYDGHQYHVKINSIILIVNSLIAFFSTHPKVDNFKISPNFLSHFLSLFQKEGRF